MYYLHLGYYKNSSTDDGDDKFTVNSIKISLNDSGLYQTEVTTNENGEATTQIPYGKYQITEIKAPEGYEALENPITVEFRQEGSSITENNNTVEIAVGENGEFIIKNNKTAKVLVHHYLKTKEGYTTEKVADDDLLEGKVGEEYIAEPHLDIEKYELERDNEGNYVVPDNTTGIYQSGTQEVTYYYELKDIPLIVHHYIEGTKDSVPLKEGTLAQDEEYTGKEGEEYTTNAIAEEELDGKYELSETPENATGIYTGNEIIVTYYYKLAERPLTIIKTGEDGEPISGVKFKIENTEEKDSAIIGDLTQNEEYYFIEQDGKYISNNKGQNDTVANSYIKIDMTNSNDKILTINAEISCEENYDNGYAYVTQSEENPLYNGDEGMIFNITGKETAKDYQVTLKGGKIYYLHFIYVKDDMDEDELKGEDTFTINSVKLDAAGTQYVVTNEQGKVTTTLKAGEYDITEVETPKEYAIPENPTQTIKITKEQDNYELNIVNKRKQATVITHYYKEGTNEKVPSNEEGKVVEDVVTTGLIGDIYITNEAENVDPRYELKYVDGEVNSIIKDELTEVIYYYNLKEADLTIRKTDKEGKGLSGAVFNVQNQENGKNVYVTTEENGEIKAKASIGETIITEVKAPDGYKLNKEPVNINIELDKENQVTVQNEKYNTFDLNINKKDGETGENIKGVTFRLKYQTQYGEEKEEKYVTSEDGTIKIENLYDDIEYTLEEIGTPKGYVGEENKYRFKVHYVDGRYQIEVLEGKFDNLVIEENQVNVTVNNTPTLKVIKQNKNGTLLPGAKFTITDEEGNIVTNGKGETVGTEEIINEVPMTVVTTDDQGRIIENLEPGKYILTEVQAPEGYKLPENKEDRITPIEITSSGHLGSTIELTGEYSVKDFNMSWLEMDKIEMLNNSTFITADGNIALAGGLLENMTIPAEHTVAGEDIVLEKVSQEDGLIISFDKTGKVVNAIKISSPTNAANVLVGMSPTSTGETIALGMFMGSINIPAEETANNQAITIEESDNLGQYMICYDKTGKVKWLENVNYLKININDVANNFSQTLILANNKIMLQYEAQENQITIPADKTASGEQITLNPNSPMTVVAFNENGKVETAYDAYNILQNINPNYEVENSIISTDKNAIISGYLNDNITFNESETVSGEVIELTNNRDGLIIKYNTEGKVEWAKQLKTTNGYSGFASLKEVNNGYIGAIYYQDELTISADQTVSGEALTLSNTTEEDGLALIKYNTEGQVEWLTSLANENIMNAIQDGLFYTTTKGYVILDMNDGKILEYTETTSNLVANAQQVITLTNEGIQTNVIAHYYIEGTKDKVPSNVEGQVVEDITLTGYVGEKYTTTEAKNVSPEYELVRIEGQKEGTFTSQTTEVIYYYRLKPMYNYTVEYYFDGVKDESLTDTKEARKDSKIETYEDKIKEGYVFEKTENLPLTIVEDTSKNVIKVYYKSREDLQYRVEYYYDGKIYDSKTETFNNIKYGTKIEDYEDKVIDGYTLQKEENLPLTVGVNPEENVIKIYYVKRIDLSYTVNYLEKGTNKQLQAPKTVGNQELGTLIKASDEIIQIIGYNYDSSDKEEITIGTGNNIINLYYTIKDPIITDPQITKDASIEVIQATSQEITYKIRYKTTITDYKGKAILTIVDKLPYEINEEKAYEIANGEYSKENKTITWQEEIEGIDTYTNGDYVVDITKEITFEYKDIDVTKETIDNKVTGTLELQTPSKEQEVEANEEITANYIVNVPVTKVWEDAGNQANKRPESIKIIIEGDSNTSEAGNEQRQEKILTKEDANKENVNEWSHTFTNLPKYNEKGEEIEYKVTEEEVNKEDLKFYTKGEATGNASQGYKLTNTFQVPKQTISIEVTKNWVDNEEQSQRRPEKLIINILGENDQIVQSYELNTKQETSHTFTNLPKYNDSGDEIVYKVQEEIPGGSIFYQKQIGEVTNKEGKENEKQAQITNTFVKPQDKIELEVQKQWVDKDNLYGVRPISIKLQVKTKVQNEEGNLEEKVVQEKIVTKEEEWKATFKDLEKYDENGQEIIYTVDEQEVVQGDLFNYEKQIGEVQDKNVGTKEETVYEKQATITNTIAKIPSQVIVKYVDKHTGKEIDDKVIKEGIVGESFDVTEDKKDIPGYTLIEEPEEKTGTFTEEPQEKIYYYAKNTKVTIKYLKLDDTPEDPNDNEVLAPKEEIQGYEGQYYETTQKDIEGYTFVQSTNNEQGTMTREEIEVIYYYSKSTKVIVRYLRQDDTPETNEDNQVLSDPEEILGYVGKEYTTTEKQIPNYTLVSTTENTTGNMQENTIEVIYYYAKNTKVIVRYLEKDKTPETNEDNQVLEYPVEIPGYEGKDYETEKLEIENYEFVEVLGNETGKMTEEEIEVIYYYAKKTKATVQHIDKQTGEILKQETKEGKVGDIFQTHAENFEGYVLVEAPENPNVEMTKEEQIVKYYYSHISAGVIEKHIDVMTNELLYSEEHKGNEGDYYNIPSKEFEGYDLVEQDGQGNSMLPENAEGTMKKEVTEVTYYYIKKAKVIVEYIDKVTGEKLTEDEIIEGHENDSYKTEEKEFDGYTLIEKPKNSEGTMQVTKNPDGSYNIETKVTYYYTKQSGGVIEKHIDIDTNKELAKEEHKGNIGDSYEILPREFEGYELVKDRLPENSKGQMTEEQQEVIYYYKKLAKVKVQYIDKKTGEILDKEEIEGHVGDSYETTEKEFDGYDLVEKPSNDKGEMTEEEIVVKYYYQRKAQVEVKYIEKETGYELEEPITLEGYVGDKYETEEKEIKYYKFIEKTDNYKGEMQKDKITVIYYYEKQVFNLSVYKWVASVNIDGIVTPAQSLSTKDELYKVDVHRSKAETANIKITYKIRIENKGEIEGTVEKLTEVIPQGYSFNQEDNEIKWEEKDGILTTEELKDEVIKAGESKEIEIVLRWNKGEENFGQKNNLVMLSKISNPAGYIDIDRSDNNAKSEMILTIATGLDRNDRVILIGAVEILILLAAGLIFGRKKMKR